MTSRRAPNKALALLLLALLPAFVRSQEITVAWNVLTPSTTPGMDEMREILNEKGYKEGIDFEYFYDETAEHNEAAWAARVWESLKFLYKKIPQN